MSIVILRKTKGYSSLITVSRQRILLLVTGFLFVLPAAFMVAGYQFGKIQATPKPDDLSMAIQSELDAQRLQVAEATRTAEENIDALALRLGKLQAHVMRLDALGQRLTTMAKLDKGEFDFEHPPAQGGPETGKEELASSMNVPDFMKSLDALSSQLDDRGKQLSVLEDMMMNRTLDKEVVPAGRPITRGWLSSYFGTRTDPFTGRRAHHGGIDFAGKLNSEVVAVAAGVVTFAGKRYGYGKLVEINHGKGYSTRYGHNNEILVKVGDMVKKGQAISKMGSTGRSTGPHVHFEVLHNGRAVNPIKYIQAAN
jgi:murein DD-endopeptidase MepM/ murein hydrolase activator NlpD